MHDKLIESTLAKVREFYDVKIETEDEGQYRLCLSGKHWDRSKMGNCVRLPQATSRDLLRLVVWALSYALEHEGKEF